MNESDRQILKKRLTEIRGHFAHIRNEDDRLANHLYETKKILTERLSVFEEGLEIQTKNLFRLQGLLANYESIFDDPSYAFIDTGNWPSKHE